jgi:ATP-dependent Clp protease ATP-binding subunit ClpC
VVWEGSERHENRVDDVAISPDGRRLVSAASGDIIVRVWDTETGNCVLHCNRQRGHVLKVSWSPDSNQFATAQYRNVCVWNATTGAPLLDWEGHTDSVQGLMWSPDNQFLASASRDRSLRLWDAATGGLLRTFVGHEHGVNGVSWSPDSRYLASASSDKTVRIWAADTGEMIKRCDGHQGRVTCVDWSSDGRLIASGVGEYGSDHTIRVWEAASGREVARYDFEEEYAWRVAWSPDCASLVSSHPGDVFRVWDARDLLPPRPALAPAPARASLPADLRPLPAALARLHRLGLHPPLSLVRDLVGLTGGRPADGELAPLAAHPGLRQLAALRWPAEARLGLAALLLQGLPAGDWAPPAGLAPSELRPALAAALAGEAVTPRPPPAPVAALLQSAERVDDRLLTLLSLLGPAAVAADPGLPLRLAGRVADLPPLSAARRRLLDLRLPVAGAGRAQGRAAGAEHSGIHLHGSVRDLLPSQLVLPPAVLSARRLRGELLYRARAGREPPRLRPAVVVLDVSPPTFGPVEATTRLAAHVLAAALRAGGLPAVLVTAGGAGAVRPLAEAADLLEVWAWRSLEPADAGRALRLARALCGQLAGGPLRPAIVVLSHPHFGAEGGPWPAVPGLRGLFVQYPGRRDRPALAAACERWEEVPAGRTAALGDVLARLLQ